MFIHEYMVPSRRTWWNSEIMYASRREREGFNFNAMLFMSSHNLISGALYALHFRCSAAGSWAGGESARHTTHPQCQIMCPSVTLGAYKWN